MARLFVLIAAAVLVYAYLKRQRQDERRTVREEAATASARVVAPAKPVRACALCGVFIPEDEIVIAKGGLAFCSEAHRRRGHAEPH
jgi:hypothetical protein